MKVVRNFEKIKIKKPVVTVGIFDGVHLAHQKIIDKVIHLAREVDGNSVLVTLWPHPKHVLPNKDHFQLKLITTLDEKKLILEQSGLDYLVVLPFNTSLAQKSFQDFTKEVLIDYLGMYQLIVGFNHQFGKGRQGDYEKLKELSDIYGFKLEQIEPFILNGQKVSSSFIRQLITEGDIKTANMMLGRAYNLMGHVEKGNKIGSRIGFPTANIVPGDQHKLIPGKGVYAVRIRLNDKEYHGMLNIGVKPTVNSGKKEAIEVNIFDFNENIYDRQIEVYFIDRIRDEKKFDSIEDLRIQLEKDKQKVSLVLSQNI